MVRERFLLALVALLASAHLFAQSWALTFDPDGRAHLPGSLSVAGTLNYFGSGGSSDVVKLSSQGIGNGGVVLATDTSTQDYRPLNLRGSTITIQCKIPDPSAPPGWSGMSIPCFRMDADHTGHFYKKLMPHGAIDLTSGGYFLAHPTLGLMINDDTDSYNRFYFGPDGKARFYTYGATPNYSAGERYLTVDKNGNVHTGPLVP